MKDVDRKEFYQKVYHLVGKVPAGYVLTYGTIAFLCERPQNSRMVGKAMTVVPNDVPAHRVVNHAGRTVPGWDEQRLLLEDEGVTFKENGHVDLKKHIWRQATI